MKIRQIIDEIQKEQEVMKRILYWLEQNNKKLEHKNVTRISCSYGLTKPQIFIDAGKSPKDFAKQFGATFTTQGSHSWSADFPDFTLTLMEAQEEEKIVL